MITARVFALAVALLSVCATAQAAVNKCTDANGKVTFQQQPCPQEARAERLDVGGDWRLLDENNSGFYGSSKTYFDPSHISTVNGYQRVAFKRTYVTGGSGKVYPDEQYFHFFECSTGLMSPRVEKGQPAPGPTDRRWDPWTQRTGPYPNIQQVFQAACHAAAQP